MYNTNQWQKQIRVDRRNLHQLIVDISQDYLFRFTLCSIPPFLHPEPVSRTGWPHPNGHLLLADVWSLQSRRVWDSEQNAMRGWMTTPTSMPHTFWQHCCGSRIISTFWMNPFLFCFVDFLYSIIFWQKIINHKTRNISEKNNLAWTLTTGWWQFFIPKIGEDEPILTFASFFKGVGSTSNYRCLCCFHDMGVSLNGGLKPPKSSH